MSSRPFAFVALAAFACAQPATEGRFAVAAVKPAQPGPALYSLNTYDDGRVSVSGMTVHRLAAEAFRVQIYQVSGGPKWASSDRWDISAQSDTPGRISAERLPQAFRHLLEDRFAAKMRIQEKEVSGYELTAGKSLRMKPGDSEPQGLGFGKGFVNGKNVGMELLSRTLSQLLDQPVIDKTALSGGYQVYLSWRPDFGEGDSTFGRSPDNVGPPGLPDRSIFTAIEEELGLKLVPKRVKVPVVIIDSVQRPGEN